MSERETGVKVNSEVRPADNLFRALLFGSLPRRTFPKQPQGRDAFGQRGRLAE